MVVFFVKDKGVWDVVLVNEKIKEFCCDFNVFKIVGNYFCVFCFLCRRVVFLILFLIRYEIFCGVFGVRILRRIFEVCCLLFLWYFFFSKFGWWIDK